MKKRLYFIILLLAILSTSCNPTKYVTFNARQAAAISFAPEVRKLLIIDRTEFQKKEVNVIEGVLSGELPGDDRKAVANVMQSFKRNIENSGRFNVDIHDKRLKGNSVLNQLPTALPWDTIRTLANAYEVDMVVAVEFFDTDFVVSTDTRTVTRKVLGKDVPMLEFMSNGRGKADVGFRIYDPVTENIVDQQIFHQEHGWSSSAPTMVGASEGIIARQNAMLYVAELAGRNYSMKLVPTTIRVRRQFFKRARRSPELLRGTRYADVNQWEESIRVWEEGLARARRDKEAGKLSYNIAVAYEVLGNLDAAIDWASRSYTEFGTRDADRYVRILRYRKESESAAQEQMGLGER